MAQKTRREVDVQHTWDLTQIFPDRKAWEGQYDHTMSAIGQLSAMKGTFHQSKETLKEGLDTFMAVSEQVDKLYVYTFLQKSGDNGDTEYQEMSAKGMRLAVEFSTEMAFLEPELLALDGTTLSQWMSDEDMGEYRQFVDNITRGRSHTLDFEREKMLAMLGEVAQIPSDAFDMLTEVDMTFPDITDEQGEKVPLTHGNFGVYRESAVQSVRKEAFEAYFGQFQAMINTITTTYAGAVKMDRFYAQVKGFDTDRHMHLFANNVPIAVYDSLLEAVDGALPAMGRYLELRKKVLGLDELNMYDLYAPIIDEVDFDISYQEAQNWVKSACVVLGEEYVALLDRAFSQRWIDIYENKGKSTGAYSCGVYGVHPYVLLNYTGKLNDCFTVAHELGHSMHSYFSDRKQTYANHDYAITVAEVASTVNEVLLTLYMLKVEKEPRRRAYLLNHFLEGFRTTVFRQALFAEFEKEAHEQFQKGVPLTSEVLNGIYRDLNERYYKGAVVNELQDIEWARIPHFYRPFYVYQYATGFCSAVAIATKIMETGDATDYLEFLSTGGSVYPIDALKIAGVDLTDTTTVAKALEVFDNTVTELATLIEQF